MNELEIINSITFYGFTLMIILFAFLSLLSNRIMYSLLFAVIVFFGIGGIFFSLHADYNAVIQIMVYGVAIPVLLLFAIMFTSSKEDKRVNLTYSPRFFIAFISLPVLFMILWYSVSFAMRLSNNLNWIFQNKIADLTSADSFLAIGNGLYINYMLAFEIFSFALLMVVVGITTLNVVKEKKHE